MQQTPSSLAALIGSRICHDLINPIGAISNGLELVSLGAPAPASPEMSLIQQSCDNATARIQFFRIAFGNADDTRLIPVAQATRTLVNHFEATRFEPVWDISDDLARNTVQQAYLGVLCVETALPQGGTLSVSMEDGCLVVTGSGPVCALEADLWGWLSQEACPDGTTLTPSQVQFALLHQLSARGAITVLDQTSEGRVQLKLACPAP